MSQHSWILVNILNLKVHLNYSIQNEKLSNDIKLAGKRLCYAYRNCKYRYLCHFRPPSPTLHTIKPNVSFRTSERDTNSFMISIPVLVPLFAQIDDRPNRSLQACRKLLMLLGLALTKWYEYTTVFVYKKFFHWKKWAGQPLLWPTGTNRFRRLWLSPVCVAIDPGRKTSWQPLNNTVFLQRSLGGRLIAILCAIWISSKLYPYRIFNSP